MKPKPAPGLVIRGRPFSALTVRTIETIKICTLIILAESPAATMRCNLQVRALTFEMQLFIRVHSLIAEEVSAAMRFSAYEQAKLKIDLFSYARPTLPAAA